MNPENTTKTQEPKNQFAAYEQAIENLSTFADSILSRLNVHSDDLDSGISALDRLIEKTTA